VAEGVGHRRGEVVIGLGGAQRGVVDHDARPHARRRGVDATRMPVAARHLGRAQRRRDRRRLRPARGGQRLGDVDDAPAAERRDQPAVDRLEQVAGDLVDAAGRHVVDLRGAGRDGGRLVGGSRRGEQHVRVAEQLGGVRDRTTAEADDALAVAPGEVVVHAREDRMGRPDPDNRPRCWIAVVLQQLPSTVRGS
jgi:hypothetical protein